MDIIGPISLPSTKGHRFILVITNNFFKWAEVIPLREVITSDVVKFIKHHIIYRYGIPRHIIHDNGPQFVSQAFTRFCDKFRIRNLALPAYNPDVNGQVEAFNKTIIKILTKLVSTTKRDCNEKLGQSL
ncbi:protein NYNRIN-like [Asparagus officinalis]|uniref:protein NYNRIN-like n=1 Tax=Asparagus officinalis TaxID=4686 RepID=UPI00098E53DA|nr:protein NYNRIN-like [Asparagus officinalis]